MLLHKNQCIFNYKQMSGPKAHLFSLFIFAVVLLSLGMAMAEVPTIVEKIHVLDDTNRGLKSRIYVWEGGRDETFLDETDKQGRLEPHYTCELGQKIKATPFDRSYYSATSPCRQSITLRVTGRHVIMNLKNNAELAVTLEEYGVAALAYSELAARARGFDSSLAADAEGKAYQYGGKAFGFPEPTVFDPTQGKRVIRREFSKAIENYQRQEGIPVTGQLDYATLSTRANAKIGRLMYVSP